MHVLRAISRSSSTVGSRTAGDLTDVYKRQRVARTDSRGRFSIRGVAPGKYRIYGLMDADQNFAFNQKSEICLLYTSRCV